MLKSDKTLKNKHLFIAGDYNTSFGNDALYCGQPISNFRTAHQSAKTNWNARRFLEFVSRAGLRVANIEKKVKCSRKYRLSERSPADTWFHPKTKVSGLKDMLCAYPGGYNQLKTCRPIGSWAHRLLSDHRPIVWEFNTQAKSFQAKAGQSKFRPAAAPNPSQPRPSRANQTNNGQEDP